jgi:hypothetical protein
MGNNGIDVSRTDNVRMKLESLSVVLPLESDELLPLVLFNVFPLESEWSFVLSVRHPREENQRTHVGNDVILICCTDLKG